MDYGEILSKAWKTIWKHKILWLFGLLAGCGAANNGGGNASSANNASNAIQESSQNGRWDVPTYISPSTRYAIEDFFQTLANIPVWVWILIALGIVAVVIFVSVICLFLRNLGNTGLIKGASMADQAGEDDKPLSLGEILKGVQTSYWKVLLFDIGSSVAIFMATFILIVPIVILAACTCGLGMLLMIPIGWFLSVMINFSMIAMVDEELPIFQAISRAWQMIINNVGQVLVMFLILGIGQILVGLAISLPLLFAVVPVIVALVTSGLEGLTIGLVISGVLFLAFLPIMIFLGSVLRAYVLVSWTLTYRRLAEKEGLKPKVIKKQKTT